MAKNEEILQFEFLTRDPEKESFKVVASSEEEAIGKDTAEIQNILAWNQNEGIAFLGTDGQSRVWKITKILNNETGEKIGLVSMAVSLDLSDQLIDSTINRSYFVLFITIFAVLLLVTNNSRLFGYAFAVSKMKEVDKMKDDFISMASHELRSPLTAIKGYLDLADENKNPENEQHMKNIKISVERLDVLVEDILEISKLEGNRIPFEITAFNPQTIIQKSVEGMRLQAEQKGLALEYSASVLPEIKADKDRMEQILINLLSNAMKYTVKGKIEVLTETKEKEFLVTIAYTGVGISAENMKNLFQKFYRIKNEETKSAIGTGLGLWITRELAKKMNGDISVESIEGVGSHFTLHLPLA
jgi:signal transduction histidine kinase